MNTHLVRTYMGTVLVSVDPEAVAKRRASGDTDASNDVMVTFTPSQPLVGFARNERMAMEYLASELRSMADSLMSLAKKSKGDFKK